MFVRYSMSIITLEKIVKPMYWVSPISDVIIAREKIVEPMYQVRPIFDVDYYTRENYHSSRCIGFVQYPISIIALEKIVEPMYQVRPIFDVDYCTRKNRRADVLCPIFDVDSSNIVFDVDYYTRENCQADVLGSSKMSIIAREKIEPMYQVRPIFDVDYCTRKNHRADVLCLSDIRCRLLH